MDEGRDECHPDVKEVEQFLAARRQAGSLIDPATADVYWEWAQMLDPYGVLNLPDECQCVGRLYFAKSPDSDIWVSQHDLPRETWRVLKANLAEREEATNRKYPIDDWV